MCVLLISYQPGTAVVSLPCVGPLQRQRRRLRLLFAGVLRALSQFEDEDDYAERDEQPEQHEAHVELLARLEVQPQLPLVRRVVREGDDDEP